MSLESFYGGRMGASFVIVKQFDGIDIKQPAKDEDKIYKTTYYAVTPDEEYYLFKDNALIKRDGNNYKDYTWKITALNGESIDIEIVESGVHSTTSLNIVLAEGMTQCFEQGGATTDEVNYGEYVIIDTPDKSNPDNGKIFRRGMNHQGDYGGAQYIGQVVGPEGATAEIGINHYSTITDISGHKEIVYSKVNQDIVPGSYVKDGIRKYNDEIKWAYVAIRDEFGNIKGCNIGFQIPVPTLIFTGEKVNPYFQDSLIVENENYLDENGNWIHPFAQFWKVRIPQGYHGIDSSDLQIIHTKTMPKNGKYTGYAGTAVYRDKECTIPYVDEITGQQIILTESVDVLYEEEGVVYDPLSPNYRVIYDVDSISCEINYQTSTGENTYAKKEDCYIDKIRYRETDYTAQSIGKYKYHYICTYNVINNIEMDAEGTITVFFSGEESPRSVTEAVDWITKVNLDQQGNFSIYFNNDSPNFPGFSPTDKRYYTVIKWIDKIDVDADGTIKFYNNNNHDTPISQSKYKIKYLNNVTIETVGLGQTDEGTGDQRVHVNYNTGESAVLGDPLNYIIEAVISAKSKGYPDAPYSHLLVYYSDPELRNSMRDKWITYPSVKYPGKVWTEWVDLGNVRGAAGGIHILTDLDDINKLYDETGQAIPPEKLVGEDGDYIDPTAYGWAVTVTLVGAEFSTIYFYDYDKENWYSIGTLEIGAAEPMSVIVKSVPMEGTQEPDEEDVTMLKQHGFWLASETCYCVE